jgi:hypothetical protein
MDTTEIRRACPLLRGPENYTVWKSKMEMVLIREKLWGIVCERRTKPESGAKAQTDFDEESERATATIFLFLSETAERYVRDLRDPVAVWAKLKEVFSKVGFAGRYNLWKRLFNIKAETRSSLTVMEYLDRVREIGIALKESGAEVSDELLVTAALQGLGEGFDTLVSVITHGERPTFDSLTILLQEEASRKKLGFIGGPGHEQAFTARQGCWHCGKIGHKRDECLGLHPELRARGASTGPLPTPTGGRGLSPVRGERAMNVREVAW